MRKRVILTLAILIPLGVLLMVLGACSPLR